MYLKRLPASDSFLLKAALLALFVFVVWFLIDWSIGSQVEVSTAGGSLTEGIVGTPRFVNPVLAVTRADKDMTTLIYDGLIKLGPDGTLVPNIAESVTISDDGLTYNVILKENVLFHDGTPLTSKDVVFTVLRIQDPAIGSPLRSSFDSVTVEEVSDREVNFVLKEPYAPFIENLTFGILPREVWKDATNEEFPFSQHNSEPIGAGPYIVKKINRNTSGIPSSYELEPFGGYHGEVPKIANLTLMFFSNEEKLITAFKAGTIDSFAGVDQHILQSLMLDSKTHEVIRSPLPRTFALFFNQNKSVVLRDKAAREALDIAVNRDELITRVLGGYAQAINTPIPPGFGIETPEREGTTADAFDEARAILRDADWELNPETGIWEKEIDDVVTPLSFSIATVNNRLFEHTAEYLRETWGRLGIAVEVKLFEQSDLTQAIIRPRDYEALLFGTAVGRPLDFYSFWHSSQRNDPGLNVALYANISTDKFLSDARTSSDAGMQQEAIAGFIEELNKETPAVFLFSPELLYVFPKRVTGTNFTGLAEPEERFTSVPYWYIRTESVWPLFTDNDTN